jgi:hypothetical protein
MEAATEEIEVVVPEAEVTEGTVPEPAAGVAPEVVVVVHVDRSQERTRRWSCDRPRFRMLR